MDHDHATDPHADARVDGRDDARAEPAVVVIAHGSRAADANRAHVALCTALSAELGRAVAPAFLELASPDLSTAVDAALAGGAGRVVVVPYFLHPGSHTTRDIPALVEEARERHPDADIVVAPLFGADPALVDALAAQVRRATTP